MRRSKGPGPFERGGHPGQEGGYEHPGPALRPTSSRRCRGDHDPRSILAAQSGSRSQGTPSTRPRSRPASGHHRDWAPVSGRHGGLGPPYVRSRTKCPRACESPGSPCWRSSSTPQPLRSSPSTSSRSPPDDASRIEDDGGHRPEIRRAIDTRLDRRNPPRIGCSTSRSWCPKGGSTSNWSGRPRWSSSRSWPPPRPRPGTPRWRLRSTSRRPDDHLDPGGPRGRKSSQVHLDGPLRPRGRPSGRRGALLFQPRQIPTSGGRVVVLGERDVAIDPPPGYDGRLRSGRVGPPARRVGMAHRACPPAIARIPRIASAAACTNGNASSIFTPPSSLR